MNGNILIVIAIASAITVTIAVLLVVLTPTQKDVNNKTSEFEETNEINSMLKKINDDRILNEESENPYYPQEREWISSGPFKIDRSQ